MSRPITRSTAVAGGRAPDYRPPGSAVHHSVAPGVADSSLVQCVRDAFVRAWRQSTVRHGERDTQVFRDAARGEGRSLNLSQIERGLRTLGSRSAAYAIAAAIMAWADRAITGDAPSLAETWEREEREEMESDLAVVQAIHSSDVSRLDAAIAEQQDNVAAGLMVLSALRAQRDRLTGPARPQGVAHYARH